jgi:hypothetical protein
MAEVKPDDRKLEEQVGVRLVMSEIKPSCLAASVAQDDPSGNRSGAQAGLRGAVAADGTRSVPATAEFP